jgi:hypothetical protein
MESIPEFLSVLEVPSAQVRFTDINFFWNELVGMARLSV